MKRLLLFIIFITFSFAEDFELSLREPNDNFIHPTFDLNMSYEEYELLSTEVSLKDIGYALIVPGYIHSKAHDDFQSTILIWIRLISYASMAYIYYDSFSDENQQTSSTSVNYLNMDTDHKIAFDTALNIALITFLYDWIRGVNVLENKQNHIRYKYGWKLNFSTSQQHQPILGLQKSF
jgi:hypothetical protein